MESSYLCYRRPDGDRMKQWIGCRVERSANQAIAYRSPVNRFFVKHLSLDAVLQNVCKISKMYYGKPTYNINANDWYKGWTYFHDNAFHSDLRDYISDTTRSNCRMHTWRLSRFISRFHVSFKFWMTIRITMVSTSTHYLSFFTISFDLRVCRR